MNSEIETQMRQAAVTPEEVQYLFDGLSPGYEPQERRERPVWTAEKREQYRMAAKAFREEADA